MLAEVGQLQRVATPGRLDVGAMVAAHRGRVVNTTGDGFVATFDSPGRAIRCGLDIAAAAQRGGWRSTSRLA